MAYLAAHIILQNYFDGDTVAGYYVPFLHLLGTRSPPVPLPQTTWRHTTPTTAAAAAEAAAVAATTTTTRE